MEEWLLLPSSNFRFWLRKYWGWFLILLFLLLGILLVSMGLSNEKAQAAPLYQSAADGKALFEQNCTGCHTIGGGKLVGPDLKDVTQRQSTDWIQAFITNPQKVVDSGDAAAKQLVSQYGMTMPTLGLTPAQVASLVAYLQNPGQVSGSAASAPQLPAGAGVPANGEMIFSGLIPLKGGGWACISCHTVNGVGDFRGGNLGPNLTHAVQRYGGKTGMASTLATLPFPTMQGIFTTRPLTASEQADLLAFFVQADAQQPVVPLTLDLYWPFWAIGGGGAALLLLLLVFFWPRQRKTAVELIRTQR
ncbi:MAG: c-type cytochrome [Omnitrophica WOR_2 bacterium]